LFEVAQLLGEALREVARRDGEYMRQHQIDPSASFIVGGQIQGEPQRLFLVYAEGNFIESSDSTNYFQIGEIKYGKPILDRVLNPRIGLADAVKLALISFDSTMRSNISGYRARIRNHGHSCFLCEIVIRSQFHTTYEPEA
jgi:Predicted proteasome-type protease